MYRLIHRYDAMNEIHCWLGWRLSLGTARSTLGYIKMPLDKEGYGPESRMAWYLDTQRRLAGLTAEQRRILILTGLGHTQPCIAQQIVCSLRTLTRKVSDAQIEIRRLTLRDQQTVANTKPHPTEAQVSQWLIEPRCQCWRQGIVGRPGNMSRGQVALSTDWTG